MPVTIAVGSLSQALDSLITPNSLPLIYTSVWVCSLYTDKKVASCFLDPTRRKPKLLNEKSTPRVSIMDWTHETAAAASVPAAGVCLSSVWKCESRKKIIKYFSGKRTEAHHGLRTNPVSTLSLRASVDPSHGLEAKHATIVSSGSFSGGHTIPN